MSCDKQDNVENPSRNHAEMFDINGASKQKSSEYPNTTRGRNEVRSARAS
jgi:hypothetical protein